MVVVHAAVSDVLRFVAGITFAEKNNVVYMVLPTRRLSMRKGKRCHMGYVVKMGMLAFIGVVFSVAGGQHDSHKPPDQFIEAYAYTQGFLFKLFHCAFCVSEENGFTVTTNAYEWLQGVSGPSIDERTEAGLQLIFHNYEHRSQNNKVRRRFILHKLISPFGTFRFKQKMQEVCEKTWAKVSAQLLRDIVTVTVAREPRTEDVQQIGYLDVPSVAFPFQRLLSPCVVRQVNGCAALYWNRVPVWENWCKNMKAHVQGDMYRKQINF